MFSRESEVSHRFHEACYLVPFKVKFKRDYGEICQEKIQSFRLSSAQSFLPKNFLFSARLLTILSQARAFFGVISIYCIFEIYRGYILCSSRDIMYTVQSERLREGEGVNEKKRQSLRVHFSAVTRELKSTSCKTNSIYLQLVSFCRS